MDKVINPYLLNAINFNPRLKQPDPKPPHRPSVPITALLHHPLVTGPISISLKLHNHHEKLLQKKKFPKMFEYTKISYSMKSEVLHSVPDSKSEWALFPSGTLSDHSQGCSPRKEIMLRTASSNVRIAGSEKVSWSSFMEPISSHAVPNEAFADR